MIVEGVNFQFAGYQSAFRINVTDFGYSESEKISFINDLLLGRIGREDLISRAENRQQNQIVPIDSRGYSRLHQQIQSQSQQDCTLQGIFVGTLDKKDKVDDNESDVYMIPIPSACKNDSNSGNEKTPGRVIDSFYDQLQRAEKNVVKEKFRWSKHGGHLQLPQSSSQRETTIPSSQHRPTTTVKTFNADACSSHKADTVRENYRVQENHSPKNSSFNSSQRPFTVEPGTVKRLRQKFMAEENTGKFTYSDSSHHTNVGLSKNSRRKISKKVGFAGKTENTGTVVVKEHSKTHRSLPQARSTFNLCEQRQINSSSAHSRLNLEHVSNNMKPENTFESHVYEELLPLRKDAAQQTLTTPNISKGYTPLSRYYDSDSDYEHSDDAECFTAWVRADNCSSCQTFNSPTDSSSDLTTDLANERRDIDQGRGITNPYRSHRATNYFPPPTYDSSSLKNSVNAYPKAKSFRSATTDSYSFQSAQNSGKFSAHDYDSFSPKNPARFSTKFRAFPANVNQACDECSLSDSSFSSNSDMHLQIGSRMRSKMPSPDQSFLASTSTNSKKIGKRNAYDLENFGCNEKRGAFRIGVNNRKGQQPSDCLKAERAYIKQTDRDYLANSPGPQSVDRIIYPFSDSSSSSTENCRRVDVVKKTQSYYSSSGNSLHRKKSFRDEDSLLDFSALKEENRTWKSLRRAAGGKDRYESEDSDQPFSPRNRRLQEYDDRVRRSVTIPPPVKPQGSITKFDKSMTTQKPKKTPQKPKSPTSTVSSNSKRPEKTRNLPSKLRDKLKKGFKKSNKAKKPLPEAKPLTMPMSPNTNRPEQAKNLRSQPKQQTSSDTKKPNKMKKESREAKSPPSSVSSNRTERIINIPSQPKWQKKDDTKIPNKGKIVSREAKSPPSSVSSSSNRRERIRNFHSQPGIQLAPNPKKTNNAKTSYRSGSQGPPQANYALSSDDGSGVPPPRGRRRRRRFTEPSHLSTPLLKKDMEQVQSKQHILLARGKARTRAPSHEARRCAKQCPGQMLRQEWDMNFIADRLAYGDRVSPPRPETRGKQRQK